VLRLAIASPLRQLFDYLPSQGLKTLPQPGVRVRVPFGSRQVCGVLVETCASSDVPPEKLKEALEIIDSTPLISHSMLALCLWAAEYYKHPLGEVLSAALPVNLRQGKPHQLATETSWQLTLAGKGLPEGALPRAPRQAALLAHLQTNSTSSSETLKQLGHTSATRRELIKKGLLEAIETPLTETPPSWGQGPALNPEQALAVSTIGSQLTEFSCFLLYGVTGSGKTEVYLRLIEAVLAAGKQALVLVPEIGLTPQIVNRLEQRFQAHIAALHSGLADGARESAWEAARSGRAHIVIGTRSAIFTSLARPGLIIVDEEHDASFKQHEGFRYSARDLAVKRGQLENVPVVLGSATPSLESLHNAEQDRYQRLDLLQRVGNSALPGFTLIDVRRKALQGGLSDTLVNATQAELESGNQVLLFLNRRGFAPTLQCHDCGYVAGCPHCDARMTLHRGAGQLRCHHCDWRVPTPTRCPECQSQHLNAFGVGTEKTETRLKQLFPDTPVHRVDRDSMQRRGAMDTLIEAVDEGKPCILLGTQMLTKGHHFPNVTLVGLLDTDASLFSAEFRGPERMGQLVTQVAGRAGRAERSGQVMLQTHYPDHPLLNTLLQRGYPDYAQQLLEERRKTQLPPFGQILVVRADARQLSLAEDFLNTLRQGVAPGNPAVSFIGPVPAALQRKAGRYRAQLLLASSSRRALQAAAEQLLSLAESLPESKRLRWAVDIDPLDTL